MYQTASRMRDQFRCVTNFGAITNSNTNMHNLSIRNVWRRFRHFGVCGGNDGFAILAPSAQMTFCASGKIFSGKGETTAEVRNVFQMNLGHSGRLDFPEFKKSRPTKGAVEKRQNRESVATLAHKELRTIIRCGGPRRITPRTLVIPV